MHALIKSTGAVLGGFIAVALLSVATDALLETFGVFPPISAGGLFVPWMLALALFYRSAYTILGGYLAARLAPRAPMYHVVVLAVIGGIAGVAGAVAGWDLSAHWYPVALAVTGPVFIIIGGLLRVRAAQK